MKYYSDKKETLSSKRTRNSLSNALVKLLKEKSFESITVQELCSESLVSRATFYNYFEDKYDLLDYLWHTLRLKIDPMPLNTSDHQLYLEQFLEKCIDFFDSNIESIRLILKHNDLSNYLINSYRIYLNKNILAEIKSCPYPYKFTIPNEMASQHYTNAILTVLEWKYVYKRNSTNEELIKYLGVLINKSQLIVSK